VFLPKQQQRCIRCDPFNQTQKRAKREQNKQMAPLAAVDGSGSDSEQVYLKMQLNKVKPL